MIIVLEIEETSSRDIISKITLMLLFRKEKGKNLTFHSKVHSDSNVLYHYLEFFNVRGVFHL